MARPRKPDGEKLVSVSTSLTPDAYDELYLLARARRIPMAELLREMIAAEYQREFEHRVGFATSKTHI